MRIYRVESFKGKGAYMMAVGFQGCEKRHPLPNEDAKLAPFWESVSYKDMGKYFFGFGDMEQLERWFGDSEKKSFAEYNSRKCTVDDNRVGVSVYDCAEEDCYIGDTQAVFIKERAQWMEFLPFVMAEKLAA